MDDSKSPREKTRKSKVPKRKWSDEFYVTAFELAKGGFSDNKIAKAMGVTTLTLDNWRETFPAFENAIKRGRAYLKNPDGSTRTFRDFVFNRLSDEHKQTWLEINDLESAESPVLAIEELLNTRGVRARQHLFFYAFVASNFSASFACRKVNISRDTLSHWINNDPDFTSLFDELHWLKGNFFEESLVDLVAQGDVHATIFANSTFNRDRGYGKTVDVNVQGTVQHVVATIDIDTLKLPLETRRTILAAYRKQQLAIDQQGEAE